MSNPICVSFPSSPLRLLMQCCNASTRSFPIAASIDSIMSLRITPCSPNPVVNISRCCTSAGSLKCFHLLILIIVPLPISTP